MPDGTQARPNVLSWMFRSRTTGRITVAQLPNWPLATWLLATVVLWLVDPQGWVRVGITVVSTLALAVWAVDEVLRGVNPFRRLLGGVVLGWLVVSLVTRG
ncbi:hypothetical protein GALL_466200 [mine drainage metagenome]|uniref:Uncharacterized protein n=1 Tax=mine drainage metagenome TaxID=410659 RepID=A0A1J5PVG4_9ZZZZ